MISAQKWDVVFRNDNVRFAIAGLVKDWAARIQKESKIGKAIMAGLRMHLLRKP
jgi:hypothetical protein